jgi:predicted SAM-dependent methyltransferase
VKEIITDWCRVLEPGGKMLLKTPDVKQICERYYPLAKEGKISWERLSAVINGGQDYPGNFHHVTFSFEWLASLLAENGMIDIKKTEHSNQNMSVQAIKGQ